VIRKKPLGLHCDCV